MEIYKLDIAAYCDKAIKTQYVTSYVYEAAANQGTACFDVMFQCTTLPKPLSCGLDDVWGGEWLKQSELYSVCVDGQITGFSEIYMENQARRLRITSLSIEPAYRGRGFATCLLEHARQLAVQRDICYVLLEVQSCNDPAMQCYLRSGFVFLSCDLSVANSQGI